MASRKEQITREEVNYILTYHPDTGLFIAKLDRARIKSGDVCGAIIETGYVRIGINWNYYYGHRLAWFLMTGEWPKCIDHRNGIRSDNRWENLRLATNVENHRNKSILSNNTSGYKGVRRTATPGKWTAAIKVGPKQTYLGTFDCPKKAHEAYMRETKKFFGEFAREK